MDEALHALDEELFERLHRHDPLNATLLGLTEFDALLPDLSGDADAAAAAALDDLAARAAALPGAGLDEREQVDRDVLVWMARAAADDARHCLWEAGASAAGYVSPQALVFQAVPATPLPDAAARARLRERVDGLAAHFDALAARYLDAAGRGRPPTATGVRQAVAQLEGHLARPLEDDVLAPTGLGGERAGVQRVVGAQVRPAMERLARVLREELAPVARDDASVGIGAVAGGAQGYRAAVARHTSLDLTPEAVHATGLEVLAQLEREWAEVGRAALGVGDPAAVRATLRSDPSLRFETREQILDVVTGALERAEAVRDRVLPPFAIGACVVEEIDPTEAGNAALAYYRPPSREAGRPGAHCVLTAEPGARFRFEYEALAFHESVPGHHLQLASAQTLEHLPRYRRHVDAQLCASIEGWGLYAERLADELGLYSSPLARLGMLSFDALRACRLVVDTGMHALGWSRQRAVGFLQEHTATPEANVRNEVDRYIAWPGQALAYMVGRREVVRLRERSRAQLGEGFDLRGFHGAVLGEGPLPLPVLDRVVAAWAAAA